ncbi:MAG: FAD-dependent oxidoreductase, partial [Terriglobales bacterium]
MAGKLELIQVAIIGAGAMGSGIAQVAATAGHRVLLYDAKPGAAPGAIARIAQQLEKLVAKGKLSADAAAGIATRLVAIPNLNPITSAGLVLEVIVEEIEPKQKLLADIEARVAPDCLLATNTSSLSIPAIARVLRAPQRLAGMHFFNPAPLMQLVEIVGGITTDPAVLTALDGLARAWG